MLGLSYLWKLPERLKEIAGLEVVSAQTERDSLSTLARIREDVTQALGAGSLETDLALVRFIDDRSKVLKREALNSLMTGRGSAWDVESHIYITSSYVTNKDTPPKKYKPGSKEAFIE